MYKLAMFFVGAFCLVSSVAAAETLNIKPGLWEVSVTGESSGAPPIPAEELAKLSPEQRARFEAAMKMAAKRSLNHVRKNCVTQKELARPFKLDKMGEGESCTQTVVSGTRTSQEIHVQCTGRRVISAVYRFEAPTPESMTGSTEMKISDGTHSMTSNGHFTGKWLGPTCGKVTE